MDENLRKSHFFSRIGLMHMQSKNESNYVAANEWLESLGDGIEDDGDEVYVGDVYSPRKYEDDFQAKGLEGSPLTASTHAGDSQSRVARRRVVRPRHRSDVQKEVVDRRMISDYRSGCRGVSWNRRMKAWLAFWMDGRTRRSKTFSSKQLGFENARLAAIDFLACRRGEESPMESPTEEKNGPYSTRSNTSAGTTRSSLSSVTTNVVQISMGLSIA